MNIESMQKEIEDCFAQTMAVLDQEFDDVISDEMAFSDLGFVGQDIIDTSRLLNSKIVNATPLSVSWQWNPKSPETGFPYAKAVREGFFAFGGKKYIPGREWDTRAIERVDPVNLLSEKLSEKGFDATVETNFI